MINTVVFIIIIILLNLKLPK